MPTRLLISLGRVMTADDLEARRLALAEGRPPPERKGRSLLKDLINPDHVMTADDLEAKRLALAERKDLINPKREPEDPAESRAPVDPYSTMVKRNAKEMWERHVERGARLARARTKERTRFLLSVALVAPTVVSLAAWIHAGTVTAALVGAGYGLLVAGLVGVLREAN